MNETHNDFRHWRVERGDDGVVVLALDHASRSANVLDSAALGEFERLLDAFGRDCPAGVIIRSGKANGFLAGADVTEFTDLQTRTQALQKLHYGQNLLNRLEALPCPTLALIHGFCAGGGLELALACDYRVVEDAPGCRLSLPEVRLGIHPGYGGSVRLPRLIGDLPALNLMLTGRSVGGAQAKRIGLADHATRRDALHAAALALLRKAPKPRRAPRLRRIPKMAPLRGAVAFFVERQLSRRVNQAHYPAPFHLLASWCEARGGTLRQIGAEADSVAALFDSDAAQQLIRVFLLRERLKARARKSAPGHVHVVGAGVMGGDIAAWCALSGHRVTLQDRNAALIAPAMARARRLFAKRLKRRAHEAADRLLPDPRGHGVERADVVIEAIIEDADAKRALYAALEPRIQPAALLATNTSSLPLEELARGLEQPARLVGLHFFNPVAKMQLIEIVHGGETGGQWLDAAAAFARSIDRLPLPVRSSPGFLVNRVLMPYLAEAMRMAGEGAAAETVDAAATDFGMPMGPLELADTVGLDICRSVAETLRRPLPRSCGEQVAAGHLGRKTGRGYYRWKNGRAVRAKSWPEPGRDLRDRLMLSLLNEAVACLHEQLVEDADVLDAGMIFGAGFAPFRGGPLQYLRDDGAGAHLARLQALAARHGERFQPAPGWDALK
ncbi:MAG: 3-hydroxyacyl-CoA dehydrogenase NAD-binding domain-containing protein [Gammaproteobacteria bacterium]|nr:3-hydroxyacyl-CoA dehydrogenase NAD-binding domain-containing protein [Gammaproteobacteria bacterium]